MFKSILYHTKRIILLTSYDEKSRKIKIYLLPRQFKAIYYGILNQYMEIFLKIFATGQFLSVVDLFETKQPLSL